MHARVQERAPIWRSLARRSHFCRAARELGRALLAVWRDPETKALPVVAGVLVLTGTIFYWRFEDWTLIESLYFCVVTLTTVGYGDFAPTTTETQIFTIIYILTGFGVLVALLTSVAQQYLRLKGEGGGAGARLRARRERRKGLCRGEWVAVRASSHARAGDAFGWRAFAFHGRVSEIHLGWIV